MTVRHATDADRDELRRLWELLQSESPEAPAWADTSWEANEPELQRSLHANALFVADTVTGVDGHVVPGLPVDRVLELIRR